MNINKLKAAERAFLENYPGGFAHPVMLDLAKKHKSGKMTALARESFAKENFSDSVEIVENMVKVVSGSSMVSLFEKPKFRDFARSLTHTGKEKLSNGLYEFLHGDEESGFESLVDILQKGKLAKWPLVTACPAYFRPTLEVFIKPTTVKNVIRFFEIEELEYKPTPTYLFYKKYRAIINKMKKEVDKSLSPDNAHFSGFLMMVMGWPGGNKPIIMVQ
ncbi:MAG: hypothetical protein HY957_01480 [Nitrospirae bacterium]|nr:hypothetical protein [Nitrospirota bacterium]